MTQKPITLVPFAAHEEPLADLTDEQLMRIGELALMK
jgi:hypothetical protein